MASSKKQQEEDRLYEMAKRYARVFATPDGEAVLQDIVFRLARTNGPVTDVANANNTFYRLGRRDLGLEVASILATGGVHDLLKPMVKK
jgi:hypothetical protein